MASAPSSSRLAPKSGKKHDVFISFMREDTRLTFTSHLHAALKRASLEAFIDDKKLEKGDEIPASLSQAIKDSSVSLVVFSQNYASSKWCLDELAHIMQYSKEKHQSVIPIFYNVDPSHVRHQVGPYKEAFEKLEKRHDHEKVTRWKSALIEVANLSGRLCIPNVTDENNLIEEIVSDVNAKCGRKYDVFINHRGEDTRLNFTSHLYAALKRASLEVFVDDQKLQKGDEIASSLCQAIKDSSVSLVVFSQNFASSTWCLDELVQIMQYRKEEGQFVIPIFYKVDPSHVRNQTEDYGKAFERHEIYFKHDPERVNRWRSALFEAASLCGRHCQNSMDEFGLIQQIVADVTTKLHHIYDCQCTPIVLIGIDKMIKPIEELLVKSHKVGICGMGGLGKTTMAKAVFDKLSSQYDSCCFLENVREKTERNGLEHVCNFLVSELLGEDMPSNSVNALRNKAYVARRLHRKKALVVLDDVNTIRQLMDLQDKICNSLAKGSKVIITTRDQQLLKTANYEIHEAKMLSYYNSRQLFISNAFQQCDSEDGYEYLIEEFVDYAQCIPLALKVLGSCVRSKDKKFWDSLLKKLRDGSPNGKIQEVLRVSYDGLDDEEKNIFLDIACFLKGESIEFVEELLESYGFYKIAGIKTLENKALITVTTSRKVEMHDLIQEMGYQIVREENIDEPEKRSRLWDPNEIYDVLKKCEGKQVEGIMMDSQRIKYLELAAKTLNNMKNLRFLKIYTSFPRESHKKKFSIPTTGLQFISSKITYFYWQGYPGKSLPSNFCAELLELNLAESKVEMLWEGVQDLRNLRRLRLQQCKMLRELPDFSRACRLEIINLSHCESLSGVPKSLLSLNSLISLDVSDCYSLESLQGGIHLKSLKQVDACGCLKLKEFSLSSEELTSLNLRGTGIEELRPSMGLCSKLKTLKLPPVLKLKKLPKEVLSCLISLEKLKISGFTLETNDIEGLRELFDHLHSLQSLRLTHLLALKELPDNITQLSGLQQLHLDGCESLTKLPDNMRHLSNLQLLSLKHCYELQSLPELPPSLRILDAYRCESLESASISSTPENCGDKVFSFKDCDELDVGSIEVQAMKVLWNAVQDKEEVAIIYPGKKVPKWFEENRAQHGLDTVQLYLSSSHNLMGFVFCVVSESFPFYLDLLVRDEGDEMIHDAFFSFPKQLFHPPTFDSGLFPGNVYLISGPGLSKSILEKLEGKRRIHGATTYNPILSFKFFYMDRPIRESGVYPIYASQWSNFKVYSRKRKTIQ